MHSLLRITDAKRAFEVPVAGLPSHSHRHVMDQTADAAAEDKTVAAVAAVTMDAGGE
jgi:hypothetical protein